MAISLRSLVRRLCALLRQQGWSLATAESCTGGLIAKVVTDEPGVSDVFGGGVITYSNISKQELLGVPAQVLRDHGAVSAPTAHAMAIGVVRRLSVDAAIAVTGIAGPAGGTAERPVGLVFVTTAVGDDIQTCEHRFGGTRAAIRRQTAARALMQLHRHLRSTLTSTET